jgi:predicted transposase/invertase (TIGR01784 family)
MPHYLDPKSDLVFKKIFGHHPELLKSFLNSLLPLPHDCVIESLTYLPTESVPELVILKHSIVDVLCLDNHGRHFIVEMQLQWTNDFIKRMLFNTAATYVRQLEAGEMYKQLSPVYGLALIDATFTDEQEWFHHYRMTSAHDKTKSLEDIQLVFIELPKLKPTSTTEKRLALLWLRFLKEINERTETVDSSLLAVEPIREALTLLETSSYTKAELRAYHKSWDAVSTEKTLLSGKYDEGLAKGLAEGRAEGKAEGLAEGQSKIVKNMHQGGLAIEQISKIMGWTQEQVQKILNDF